MKRFYDKKELYFALIWIGVYVVLLSFGDNISASVGIKSIATLPIAFLLCFGLFMFLKNNGLLNQYGLKKPRIESKKMLYYVPLILLLATNLLYGVGIYYSILEIILYILTMLCVGFLEEIIFRGFLFKKLVKESKNMAVVVTTITFGIGHILNLFNGAELVPTLLQICYAMAGGYLFVMVLIKSKSLWPCIITHSLLNSLSIFSIGSGIVYTYLVPVLLFVISLSYALYVRKIKVR